MSGTKYESWITGDVMDALLAESMMNQAANDDYVAKKIFACQKAPGPQIILAKNLISVEYSETNQVRTVTLVYSTGLIHLVRASRPPPNKRPVTPQ
jgi:hypothetical protein